MKLQALRSVPGLRVAMNLDNAYGAVVGACVGDAAGAVLEFAPRPNLQAVITASDLYKNV